MRDISSTAMQYQGMHKDSEAGSPQSVRPGWARTALEETVSKLLWRGPSALFCAVANISWGEAPGKEE